MSAQHYTTSDVEDVESSTIIERTPEDARKLLDSVADFYFGISGEELLRRWDAGEYADRMDESRMEYMAMFLPLIREEL